MPFHLPFNFPFFYNRYPRPIIGNMQDNINNFYKPIQPSFNKASFDDVVQKKEDSKNDESSFEIFGFKLYFDDILIICLLYFLYTEKVQDTELFICLILLLLS